jgi:putative ABC transport system substrate-binding protein
MKSPRAAIPVVLALALVASPRAADPQAPQRVVRIGYLTPDPRPPDVAMSAPMFRRELLALGYVEGQHYVLEYRFASGVAARLPALAAELVALPVDLIVANSTPAALAAKGASTTVPIVFNVAADPVQRGLVDSFARPGGNVTGFTAGFYDGKRLQALKEAVPGMSRAGYLCDCPSLQSQQDQSGITSAEARNAGVQIRYVHVGDPTGLARALASAANAGLAGLVVADLSWMATVHFKQIADFTTTHRLPTIGPAKRFVEVGGLIYYGPRSGQNSGRVAAIVDKILKGAKPVDLPVEQPTLFELVVNLKTAKAIGLTIAPSVLARVDQVIQ